MRTSANRIQPLDRDRVVQAALRLLDDVGLDGLSLRRLAVELDVKAPALYWHFQNKQDLLDGMAHEMTKPWLQAVGSADVGPRWDEWLLQLARDYRTLLLSRRDGARLVSSTRPRIDGLPLLDSCIAVFQSATGCRAGEALRCLNTMTTFVRGFVLDAEAERHRPDEQFDAGSDNDAQQALESSPHPVPHLSAAIEQIGSPGGEGSFEYGLRLVVEGIRAALNHAVEVHPRRGRHEALNRVPCQNPVHGA